MKEKEIEKELFSLVCLYGKVRKKKKIMMSKTILSLYHHKRLFSTINIESYKK